MTIYSVNDSDLQAALASSKAEAINILGMVNNVQQRLQNTNFIGESATHLAGEMNTKMDVFVLASYDNVDELLRVIVNNMNVVVTKLGGQAWQSIPVNRDTAVRAEAATGPGVHYEIDLDDMGNFATQVDDWFEQIATGYLKIQGTIADGTPQWQGPEKIATVNAVSDAVQTIIGTAGGEVGVRGVGASLSGLLREQVTLMQAT